MFGKKKKSLEERVAKLEQKTAPIRAKDGEIPKRLASAITEINDQMAAMPRGLYVWYNNKEKKMIINKYENGRRAVVFPEDMIEHDE